MSDSILKSTKKALDVPENYDVFDGQILMHINSVFSTLNQLGIGPVDGFEIEDDTATWTEYLQGNSRLNCVKTYMYLRVRYLFDPPATSFLLTAMKEQMTELEWRISAERETASTPSTLLLGGHKKITGNLGDEHRIRLANPAGQTLIDATGTYQADFTPKFGTPYEVALDVSQRSVGVLYLPIIIKEGVYTVRSLNPTRTILVLEVSVV